MQSLNDLVIANLSQINIDKSKKENQWFLITFEYALIAGQNDTAEDAKRLGALLKGMLCHVNLIPVNPIAERDFQATSQQNAEAFVKVLKTSHIEANIRRKLGYDIDAC